MSTVLVTGGSGFVGSHTLLQLLAAGHEVRTTVRTLAREADVRALLKQGGAEHTERLTFHTADLERDEGWTAAVAGCEYVLHVASGRESVYDLSRDPHEDVDLIARYRGTPQLDDLRREVGRMLEAEKATDENRLWPENAARSVGGGKR